MSDAATTTAQEQPKAEGEQKPTTEVQAQGTEAQAGADGSGDTGKPTTEAEAKPQENKTQVPEKYELKVTEGSLIDSAHLEKIALFAKERGLSQEQAQMLVERDQAAVEQHMNMVKQWKDSVQNDPELGGDNMKEKVELAHRAFKHFASEEFAKELEITGYGNHPELLRAFYKVGKMMGNDKFVVQNSQAGAKRTMEEVFYGKQNT